MGDSRAEPGSAEDIRVAERLRALRELEPPGELRNRVRFKVNEALGGKGEVSAFPTAGKPVKSAARSCRTPLWRRKISVPAPMAAMFVLVLAVTLFDDLLREPHKTNVFNKTEAPAETKGNEELLKIAHINANDTPPISPVAQSGRWSATSDFVLVPRRESVVIAGLGSIQTNDYIICERE